MIQINNFRDYKSIKMESCASSFAGGVEVEDGEIVEKVKVLTNDLEETCGMTGSTSLEGQTDGLEKHDAMMAPGISNFEENAIFTAAIDSLHERLVHVEQLLNIHGAGNVNLAACRRTSRQISRDAMLEIIIETINSHGLCGRNLIRKQLSDRLQIDFHSQYYCKKLSAVLKYGLAQNLFSFCKREQLFKKLE